MTAPSARRGAPHTLRFVILLVPVLALLGGLRSLMAPDHGVRNVEYMPDMATSLAVESQSLAPTLPGGLSQQPLVAGVVPRGRLPLRFGPGDEEAERAGRELESPFAADDAAATARGAEVYGIHCSPCHGAAGDGRGPAVLRGMLAPPSFRGASAMQMPDGRMFHVVTLGRGNMPAMRARLDAADRWRVIRHVRALQRTEAPGGPAAPAGDGETEENGR